MSYATVADMSTRFGLEELTQLSDPTGQLLNQVVVAAALADADAVIDMHISARYTLPLASVPRILVNIACDLARAYLHDQQITELVRKRQEDAMALLKSLADGRSTLPDTGGTAVAQSSRTIAGQTRSGFNWSGFGGVR